MLLHIKCFVCVLFWRRWWLKNLKLFWFALCCLVSILRSISPYTPVVYTSKNLNYRDSISEVIFNGNNLWFEWIELKVQCKELSVCVQRNLFINMIQCREVKPERLKGKEWQSKLKYVQNQDKSAACSIIIYLSFIITINKKPKNSRLMFLFMVFTLHLLSMYTHTSEKRRLLIKN